MKDRLNDLKQAQAEDVVVVFDCSASSSFMKEFFDQVEDIRSSIDDISNIVKEVDKIHSSILESSLCDEKAKAILEEKLTSVKKTANRLRTKLKSMEQSILKEEAEVGDSAPADLRIRKAQHLTLSRKLVTVMDNYNRIQEAYRESCKARIQRQLNIVGKHVDGEQLEQMIGSGNPGIFTQDIITDTQQAKQTLADIKDRHDDIIKLEKSIIELRDMFDEMSKMVEQQGEIVDRIETSVEQSRDYVETAAVDVRKASEYQTKARKKKLICFILLVVALSIITLIIVASVCTQKGSC